MRGWLAFAGLALLAGCAAGGDADRDDAAVLAQALANKSAEPAERCVSASRLGTAQIVGQSLLYRDGRTVWRNDIADCPSLSGDPILVVEVFADQLCAGDPFRTLPRGGATIPGPICRFGQFTPYRAPR